MCVTRFHALTVLLTTCAGCSSLSFVDVPAEIQTERIDHLVIHFTGEDFAESMRLRIYRLVDEDRRAWHAGESYWRGVTALNARSIGIEIVNRSRCEAINPETDTPTPENQRCDFLDFDSRQIALVIELARDILARNPGIDPEDVVAHADIALTRRADPGPRFPWYSLYEQGIGAWYDDATVAAYRARFDVRPPSVELLQRALSAWGYRVEITGSIDTQTRFALRALQMHFRPSDWSGQPDIESVAILFALIEKYRSRALADLRE